jgi:hypothetical protein
VVAREGARRKEAGPGAGRQGGIELSEENIGQVEKDTLQKVNKVITVLESAIAAWDASGEKREDLKPRFAAYKRLRDALAEWEAKALKAAGKKESFDEKARRLREFAEICFMYGEVDDCRRDR